MDIFAVRRLHPVLRRHLPKLLLTALGVGAPTFSLGGQIGTQRLRDHVPPIVGRANVVGRVSPTDTVPLALTLPLRNQAQLDTLLVRLYTPGDPFYGHYLTSTQFAAQFAPTQAQYETVAALVRAQGLSVKNTHANRLVLDVEGSAQTVESAFGVRLHHYRLPEGRVFRAPDSDPVVPAALASRLQSVVGLDTAGLWHPYNRIKPADTLAFLNPQLTGSGPGRGLSPSDIKTAYNLNGVALTGSGQSLALFELDGYKASDINFYENYFGLPNVQLQNVLVDGATGAAGNGSDEVTLDIELQIALAPGASSIYVYEGANSSKGVIDTYSRIASDNLAKSVSISWGLDEKSNSASLLNSENTIFKQMAAQGQSVFAASGDSGAYDNGSTLSVDDPASQPYVTGVGGTSLTTNGAGGAWKVETTWNGGSIGNGGGGGGISQVWTIPSYQSQSGVLTSTARASSAMRNVPDVAIEADPSNGYSIYSKGKWYIMGGTSCAAPLWSAFTALVNQQLASTGRSALGFANPALYTIGIGANGKTDFHDIADGSTNLYYPAVTGYDLATGWGTPNGANLLTDLVAGTVPTYGLYRLFNPATTLHLLTSSAGETAALVSYGWNYEGVIGHLYSGPGVTGTTPLYRLFNPRNGDHLYTASAGEYNIVLSLGYNVEGVSGYVYTAAANGLTPLYRLFNSATGEHLFTTSVGEYNALPAPWNREGNRGLRSALKTCVENLYRVLSKSLNLVPGTKNVPVLEASPTALADGKNLSF